MSSNKWEKHSAQTHLYSLCLLKPVTALVSIVHARPVSTIPLYSTMTAIWVFYAIPPEHIKCLSLHLFANSVSHSLTICFLYNDFILPHPLSCPKFNPHHQLVVSNHPNTEGRNSSCGTFSYSSSLLFSIKTITKAGQWNSEVEDTT